MNTDLKQNIRNYDRTKRGRRHQEEALDGALKNTFPASDPVSTAADAGRRIDAMGYYRTSRGGRAISALMASLDDSEEMPS